VPADQWVTNRGKKAPTKKTQTPEAKEVTEEKEKKPTVKKTAKAGAK